PTTLTPLAGWRPRLERLSFDRIRTLIGTESDAQQVILRLKRVNCLSLIGANRPESSAMRPSHSLRRCASLAASDSSRNPAVQTLLPLSPALADPLSSNSGVGPNPDSNRSSLYFSSRPMNE